MNSPRVTVCVPVYNTAPYIRQCIESVFAQEYKDWVLVVADNCSTDGTWEILETFHHPQVKLFRHDQNMGPRFNWDFVHQKVETEYFCFLGSDDYFYPAHLANKVRLLDEATEAPFVHGAVDFVDKNGDVLPFPGNEAIPIKETKQEVLRKLLIENYINITTVLFRKASFDAQNLMIDSRLRFFGDWHLFLELALFAPFVLYDAVTTAAYRFHDASDARQNIRSFEWTLEACEHRLASLAEHPSEWATLGFNTREESRKLTENFWTLALQQIRFGKFLNARKAWVCYRHFHSLAELTWRAPKHLVQKFT